MGVFNHYRLTLDGGELPYVFEYIFDYWLYSTNPPILDIVSLFGVTLKDYKVCHIIFRRKR